MMLYSLLILVNINYRHFCKGKMPVFKNTLTLERRRDIRVNITEFTVFLLPKKPRFYIYFIKVHIYIWNNCGQ